MSISRKDLIKLAHAVPELRHHLVPLIRVAKGDIPEALISFINDDMDDVGGFAHAGSANRKLEKLLDVDDPSLVAKITDDLIDDAIKEIVKQDDESGKPFKLDTEVESLRMSSKGVKAVHQLRKLKTKLHLWK